MKKLFFILAVSAASLALMPLSGCTDRSAAGSSSSSQASAQSSSQSSEEKPSSEPASSASSDPELTPARTPAETADRFIEALTTHNMTAIAKYTGTEPDVYASWKNVEFDEITYKTLSDDYSAMGYYDFTFHVAKSDVAIFPVGTSTKEVMISTSDGAESLVVCSMYSSDFFPFERTPLDMARDGFEAYSLMNDFNALATTKEFAKTSDIPTEEIVEFSLMRLAKEYDFEKQSFTKEQMGEQVTKLFGISDFDGTSTRFFNKGEGTYTLQGRGFSVQHKRTVSAELVGDIYTVPVEFFTDPLCTQKSQTIVYTIKKNGQSLQLISGVKK